MRKCEFPDCDCPTSGFEKLCKHEPASSCNSELLSVYVLLDCDDYEGCVPLHVFKHKESAEKLKALAEDYDEKKPLCPDCIADSDECYAEWSEYEKVKQEWQDNHPIKKGFFGADFYSIAEVPFHT